MSTSSGIRGIRRKKSSLSEVKIGIIGSPGVGKSALAVRFLTKRYIGTYNNGETRYKHEILVDGEPILFEICDTCPKHENDMPQTENCINWADGFILVYSITDRSSFNYIKLVKQYITDMRQGSSTLPPQSAACAGSGGGNSGASSPNSTSGSTTSAATATAAAAAAVTAASATSLSTNVPFVLLGNKGDMVHLRQVASEEGEILAKDFDCYFAEVAAADQVNEIADAFHELCREVNNSRRKNKTSLLDRVLGKDKAGGGLRAYSKRGLSDSVLSN